MNNEIPFVITKHVIFLNSFYDIFQDGLQGRNYAFRYIGYTQFVRFFLTVFQSGFYCIL